MTNQTIGVGGAFVLTLFLFLLRHFYLTFRRRDKRRHTAPTTVPGDYELNKKPAEDNAWLLWTPGLNK